MLINFTFKHIVELFFFLCCYLSLANNRHLNEKGKQCLLPRDTNDNNNKIAILFLCVMTFLWIVKLPIAKEGYLKYDMIMNDHSTNHNCLC